MSEEQRPPEGTGAEESRIEEPRSVYRATFKIDLSNPTEDQLSAIKNQVVERIARSVVMENAMGPVSEEEMMAVHDKHDSFHQSG